MDEPAPQKVRRIERKLLILLIVLISIGIVFLLYQNGKSLYTGSNNKARDVLLTK